MSHPPPGCPQGPLRCLPFSLVLPLAHCPPGSGPVRVSQPINPSVARTTGAGVGALGPAGVGTAGRLSPASGTCSSWAAYSPQKDASPPSFFLDSHPLPPPRTLAARGLGKYLKRQLGGEESGGNKHFCLPLLSGASLLGLSAWIPCHCATWRLEALQLERGSSWRQGNLPGLESWGPARD